MFTLFVLIAASILPFGAAYGEVSIIGSRVRTGGSISTCALVEDDSIRCTATLIEGGHFRTAGHCTEDLARDASIVCGANRTLLFRGQVSNAKKHPKIGSTLSKEEWSLPWDSGILHALVSPSPTSDVILAARPVAPSELGGFFEDESGKYRLRTQYSCWAESWGPNARGSYALRRATIADLIYRDGIIQHSIMRSVSSSRCPSCAKGPSAAGKIFETPTILKVLGQRDPIDFLTLRGDSGGPLYCADRSRPLDRPFLIGTLSGSMNRVMRELPGRPKRFSVRLGSYWVPLLNGDEFVSSHGRENSKPEIPVADSTSRSP